MRPPSKRAIGGLAAFGSGVGPLVDGVHNQALLEYDIQPLFIGALHTSLLVPPLLAVAYVILGYVLPTLMGTVVQGGITASAPMTSRRRAALAVTTTVVIIKASELLSLSSIPAAGSVAILAAACLVQWASLDGAWASLLLALLAGFAGPLCELPLIQLGCWHYVRGQVSKPGTSALPTASSLILRVPHTLLTHWSGARLAPNQLAPDYYPLADVADTLGVGSWAGLRSITGPCYFAVTTDAIAVGRWLAGDNDKE